MTKAITTISNSQFSATGQFVSLAETNVVRINFGETVLPTDATTFFAGKILIGMDLEVRVGPQGSTITYTAASTNKPANVAALFAAFDAVKLPGIPTLNAKIDTLRSDITGGTITATDYDTLFEISNAIAVINGSGAGSITKAVTDSFNTLTTNYNAAISAAITALETKLNGGDATFSPANGLSTFKAISLAVGNVTDTDTTIYGRLKAIETKLAAMDTIAPTVQSITLSATGAQSDTLNAGDVITATVKFSEAVGVEGAPTVALGGIGANKVATYASGAGSDTLVFTYTVQANDTGTSITAAASALSLNGGRIVDLSNNAPSSLTASAIPTDLSLAIDTEAPTATLTANTITSGGNVTVSSSEAGTAYLVNEKVNVTSLASITSATDDLWNSVSVSGGSSTSTLAATGLINGTYKLYTVDAAGNLSAASSSAVTIDTPVVAGDIRFVNLTDTGTSEPSAPITRDNNFSLQRVGGSASDIVAFEKSTDGITWASTTDAQSNVADGTYLYRAKVTAGGNTTYTAPIQVTIDTTADASSTVMVTAISDDTGSSGTDGITQDATPTLTITAAPNSTVEVLRAGVKVGEAIETATPGTYTFVENTALGAGTYVYTARTIDAAGNTGAASASKSVTIDTTAATATITLADTALKAGETSLVTITFNEAVTGFTNDDLTVANGMLTAVSSADNGVTWTATFTPTADLEDATNVITLDNTGVLDVAGNAGTGTTDSANYAIDTLRPTVTISDDQFGVATDADRTVLYTFQFSESVTGFTTDDVTVTGGTKGTFTVTDGDTYTLEVTADDDSTTNLSVTAAKTDLADTAGNLMAADAVDATQVVDTKNPVISTIALTADSEATFGVLNEGDTVTATVTFDQDVVVFGVPQLALVIGSTTVQASYTATGSTPTALNFTYTILAGQTDTDGISIDVNALTLNNGTIKDVNGNDAVITSAAVAANGGYKVDTTAATATITLADTALKAGETSLVTITFNEAVTGFTNDDLTVANGMLTAVSSADNGVTWTATFTPTADLEDATNVITLDNTGVLDVAGNAGTGTTDSANYAIDTLRPTVTISDDQSGVATDADRTVLYTFQFSESVTGFAADDVTVTGGNKGTFSATDGDTYTLEVTADDDSTTNLSVTVANTDLVDAAGNLMTASTTDANQVVDTKNPVISTIALTADSEATYPVLNAGDTVTATVTFDQAVTVTGTDTPQLTLQVGSNARTATLSDGSGTTALTFTYTIQASDTDTDGIAFNADALDLNGGTIKDANGNDAVITSALVAANGDYKVDTTAPNAPSITAYTDDTGTASDGITSDTTPTLTITAETGATVEVFRGTDSVGFATETGTAGTFTFTSAALSDAAYSFTAKATDLAGNTSGASTALSITVDTIAPTATAATVTATGFIVTSNEVGKLNNRATSSLNASATTITAAEGTVNTVTLAATDAAGNSRDLTFDATSTKITLAEGSSSNDTLTATDTQIGLLYGLGGNDNLTGGALGDFLSGGAGMDTMSGGSGDDTIFVDADADTDVVDGGLGNDTIDIGTDSSAALDELHFRSIDGTDTVNGIVLNGSAIATNDFIAFLDNGSTDLVMGSVNFAASDSTSGVFGTRFTGSDAGDTATRSFDSYASFTAVRGAVNNGASLNNKIIKLSNTDLGNDVAAELMNVTNVYLVVDQGSNVEIYFDNDWSNTTGRTKVATLVGVDINDIDVTDFGVYAAAA